MVFQYTNPKKCSRVTEMKEYFFNKEIRQRGYIFGEFLFNIKYHKGIFCFLVIIIDVCINIPQFVRHLWQLPCAGCRKQSIG